MKKIYTYPQIEYLYINSDVITTSLYEMKWDDGENLNLTNGAED